MKAGILVLFLASLGACASSSCTPYVYGTAGTFTFHEDDEITPAGAN